MKKILWKDILKSISKSKGRFFSIMGLMLIGSFALVGLKVTGPNMRATGADYFQQLQVSDLTIIGSLGIDENDQHIIDQTTGIRSIEYGYLKDVVIKGQTTSVRLFSKGETVSDYEILAGRLPDKDDEIALGNSYRGDYHIGDTIEFIEKEDQSGATILTGHTFKIVGFVYSGEIISSINQGVSTAGTGALNGYAVVSKETFASDVYMLARITFDDLTDVDPYSDVYTDKLQDHKNTLTKLLENQPYLRLQTVKKEFQEKIDEGQAEIDAAKQTLVQKQQQLKEAASALDTGQEQISQAENELDAKVAEAQNQIETGQTQIEHAQATLADGEAQLNAAQQQLAQGQATLSEKQIQLQRGKQQLDQARNALADANEPIAAAAAAISNGQGQITAGYAQLSEKQAEINAAKAQIASVEQALAAKQASYKTNNQAYKEAKAVLDQKQQAYEKSMQQLQTDQTALDSQKQSLITQKEQFESSIQQKNAEKDQLTAALQEEGLSLSDQEALQTQLATAAQELTALQNEYNQFIDTDYSSGMQEIADNQQGIDTKATALEGVKQQIEATQQTLDTNKASLDQAADELTAANQQLDAKKHELDEAQNQVDTASSNLSENEQLLGQKQEVYQTGLQQYQTNQAIYNQQLQAYYTGLAQWVNGVEVLDTKSAVYQENIEKLTQAKQELANKDQELATAKDTLAEEEAAGIQEIADAKATLAEKKQTYEENKDNFDSQKTTAEDEITEKQAALNQAQETIDHLSLPTYTINSRREIPGSEGYRIYSSISNIVDALANIFPIFLYFVAALVTLTTMARFVDEERIKAGTLKALGYEDKDVRLKFIVYGLTSSLSGTIMGIILGHTLLPLIVNNAYQAGFTVPSITLQFHWGISIVAILLAIISAVIPAYIVSTKELKEKPAQLLLPKPPTAGSKILLERIKPIWNRMSFTHKVTARNIFRYKQRMLMTIFGVAGAVALLFAGFSVQHSIGGINDRQFGDLIHYDMIVAKNDYVSNAENQHINDLLKSNEISQSEEIHYEELSTVAGDNKDTQQIKLIVPKDSDKFSNYMNLVNRKSGESLALPDNGVIISERLAILLDVKFGDSIELSNSNNDSIKMKVSGITEMYMGHFVFTSLTGYDNIFGTKFTGNGYLVNLKNNSLENTKKNAANFMNLSGVKGVMQNTTVINQINTIVTSLNKIMTVLIIVAAMLAIVILYNLTNINVSERIRELSTIKVLGFYNNEVTMYIYRETIVLTLLGIATGFGFGGMLHRYIILVVPPDDVMFNPTLSIISFLIPLLITVLITIGLAFVINRRLKEVDMLEALKSAE